MPFKSLEARREYMRNYLSEWREGKRRGDGGKLPERTRKARAAAEKKRKRLWFLQNKEWCMAQQRERRRAARADAERGLLRGLPPAAAKTLTPARRAKNKTATNPRKAA